jgi:hypothetical protein
MKDNVNHPSHYNAGKFEVIDVIEDWGLGFNDGNAIKYIARARHKGNQLEDLKKAKWYIEREIARNSITVADPATDQLSAADEPSTCLDDVDRRRQGLPTYAGFPISDEIKRIWRLEARRRWGPDAI